MKYSGNNDSEDKIYQSLSETQDKEMLLIKVELEIHN